MSSTVITSCSDRLFPAGAGPSSGGRSIGFYRRPPLPVLQVAWPDADGRFPWDPCPDLGYVSASAVDRRGDIAKTTHPSFWPATM
ncbi:DUF4262 domain-containing protein [Streptomyces sp. NPDC057494]|uniref:DUF4262 domain-containing protein n=1 Tax=Streptomyces sp. NPDC057494 TaxID=3346148 RepID=UPI00367757B9